MSRFRKAAACQLALAAALLAAGPVAAQGLKLGLGRPALPEEVAAWDIDVRPDGQGLPRGKGTAKQGDALYSAHCAACHGDFGQGVGRWPAVAGGKGTLRAERPEKTIGSFWPDLSTVFDYVRRTMPFGKGQTLTVDETYAVVAYLLLLNDIVTDENFELDERSFQSIRLPNAGGFYDDDRETAEKRFWGGAPCMTNCKPEARITARAASPDITPGASAGPKLD
jgi:cytochrome c